MRARNIKPGFFTDEELLELPPLTRILFAGLWCLADRAGRLPDKPRRIKIEVLPCDDCDVDAALQSMHDRGLILRYEVDGVHYIQIENFLKHQNPHVKEVASVIPPPDGQNENLLLSNGEHSASTVQAPCEHHANPADSGFLIPDSGSLISDSGLLIAENGSTDLPRLLAQKIPGMRPQDYQTVIGFEESGMPDEVIALAVEMAVLKGKPGFGFVRFLLNEWLLNEVRTADAAREYEKAKMANRSEPKQDRREPKRAERFEYK